ncbi:hypothetical protein AKJ16_DCAP02448 [Drosera capensis]
MLPSIGRVLEARLVTVNAIQIGYNFKDICEMDSACVEVRVDLDLFIRCYSWQPKLRIRTTLTFILALRFVIFFSV